VSKKHNLSNAYYIGLYTTEAQGNNTPSCNRGPISKGRERMGGGLQKGGERDEKRGEGNSLTPSQAEKNKHCSSTTNMCKETERYDCRPGASAERT